MIQDWSVWGKVFEAGVSREGFSIQRVAGWFGPAHAGSLRMASVEEALCFELFVPHGGEDLCSVTHLLPGWFPWAEEYCCDRG